MIYLQILVGILLLSLTIRQLFLRKKNKHTVKSTSLVSKYTPIRQLLFLFFLLFLGIATLPLTLGTIAKDGGKGVDIMVMLDVSKSMKVADISYQSKYTVERIITARNLLGKLVTDKPGNRWGLGVFAGNSVGISPLTSDTNLFLTFLQGVDEQNISIGGTNLGEALKVGISRFDTEETKRGKVLILISDGGEEKVNISNEIKNSIKEQGIFVVTIGLGTLEGGKVIEGKDIWGNVVYKNQGGQNIISKFNPTSLKSLANTLEGKFFHITSIKQSKKVLKSFNHIQKSSLKNIGGNTPRSLSPWFLFLSLICFLGWIGLGLDEKTIKKIIRIIYKK